VEHPAEYRWSSYCAKAQGGAASAASGPWRLGRRGLGDVSRAIPWSTRPRCRRLESAGNQQQLCARWCALCGV